MEELIRWAWPSRYEWQQRKDLPPVDKTKLIAADLVDHLCKVESENPAITEQELRDISHRFRYSFSRN